MIHLGSSYYQPVFLEAMTLRRHMAVTGVTGAGKSVFLLNVLFQLAQQGHKFAILDRDGQTAREAWSMLRPFGAVFLRPGEKPFHMDPFYKLRDLQGADYDIALLRTAEDIAQVLAEKIQLAGFTDQLRRNRVLLDAIYLCGQRRENGSYLGMHRLQAAAQFGLTDYFWNHIFNPLRGLLPREREEDILRIVGKSSPRVDDEIQSTINIVSKFMQGETMKEIFRPVGVCVDFEKLTNHIVCIDLQETEKLSTEQANSIGAILNLSLINAAKANPNPYFIVLEEADKMLGHSVSDVLRRARKTNTGMIVCVQQLSSLKNERVDVATDASGLVGTLVTFQTQSEEELKTLGFIQGIKSLDFERDVKIQQLHAGYKFVVLNDFSEGRQNGDNWTISDGIGGSVADAQTHSNGVKFGINQSRTQQTTHTDTENEQESLGESESDSLTKQSSKSSGAQTFVDRNGERHVRTTSGDTAGGSSGSSNGRSHEQSQGRSWSFARGLAEAFGFNLGWDQSDSQGRTKTRSWNRNRGRGGNRTRTRNKTRKTVPLAQYRILKQDGGMKTSTDAQIARMQQVLSLLPVGWFVLSTLHYRPILVKGKMRKAPNLFHRRSECWQSPLFFDTPEAETCKLPEIKKSSKRSANPKRRRTSGN